MNTYTIEKKIFISLIIPVYNSESFLHKCIDSVIAQDDNDWELIIVNDGSTDNSKLICDSYAEKNMRIRVFHTQNEGVSHARNIGIENAKGEWIGFIDSDDWISTDYVSTLKKSPNKADVIFFNVCQVFPDNTKIKRHFPDTYVTSRQNIESTIASLKFGNIGDVFGWPYSKIYKRSIIIEKNIHFVENLQFREDEIFSMDYCLHINSLMIIDKILYFYRFNPNGLSCHGMSNTDRRLLIQHLIPHTKKYTNEKIVIGDKKRIRSYYIDILLSEFKFESAHKQIRPLHSFLKKNPEYRNLGPDHIAAIMDHPFWISWILFILDVIIKRISINIGKL